MSTSQPERDRDASSWSTVQKGGLLQMTPPTEELLWSFPNSPVNNVPKTRQKKITNFFVLCSGSSKAALFESMS